MIQAWLAKMWAWLIAIGAALLVIFGFYEAAKHKGAEAEHEKNNDAEVKRIDSQAVAKVEQAQEVAAVVTEKVQNANEAISDVNKLNNGDAANQLRDEWARD